MSDPSAADGDAAEAEVDAARAGTAEADDRPLVLFIDNFDSFTYNLVEYVSAHAETAVLRNTATLAEVRAVDPDAIVISPGPGHPKNERDVGVTEDVLQAVSPDVPTLGVCLGLEAAAYAYGGSVGRAPEPIHGKAYPVDHDGEGVFEGLDQGFRGGRYHSLVVTDVPDCFEVSATTEQAVDEAVDGDDADGSGKPEPGGADGDPAEGDGEELVMGLRHREHPIECVQFHPESVLTAVGHDVIENFLAEL